MLTAMFDGLRRRIYGKNKGSQSIPTMIGLQHCLPPHLDYYYPHGEIQPHPIQPGELIDVDGVWTIKNISHTFHSAFPYAWDRA